MKAETIISRQEEVLNGGACKWVGWGTLEPPGELPSVPPGTQGQEFQLRVEPQNPVVPAGGSLLVNCSTDCPSAELISLETSLLKESVGSGLGWAAFQLSNVTGDIQLLCSGFCNGSQMIGFSNITVYREWLCLEVELALGSSGAR